MSTGNEATGPRRFRPFTRESLARIQQAYEEKNAEKKGDAEHQHHEEEKFPDPLLEQGLPLPRPLERDFPPDLIATPIEEIDKYYIEEAVPTFVVISKGKDIFRFSATKALYVFDPFHPIRRVAIYMLVHPWFSFLVIVTILVNCILMTWPPNEAIEDTEIIFTTVYTFESCLKITARGFIVSPFTYLRDPWNWLDFVVITLAYLTMFIPKLGNLSALRTFRVLRALKTVAIIPGMKTIVGAVIESVKNLKDVIILTCFSLSIFALLGLQIYSGALTQKCILKGPSNQTDEEWYAWNNNESRWALDGNGDPFLCSNSSGAQLCEDPTNYICLPGFGPNPNYDYTSFDSFGWALLCAFRLMTQDAWENLYQLVLRATSPYNIIFFIAAIFLGSIYLVNLILAIVAMSYDELQKKALEEEEQAAAEEAAYQESQRQMEEDVQTRSSVPTREVGVVKSPSDYSCRSYDMQNEKDEKERFSIRSDDGDCCNYDNRAKLNGKMRKASLSLPGSPFNLRRGSRGSQFSVTWARNGRRYNDRKPLVLHTYLDAQEHLPYADDSTAATPMSEENGAIIIPVYTNLHSRHSSYTSHSSRISYTSHGDIYGRGIPWTKESQLLSRRNLVYYGQEEMLASDDYLLAMKPRHPENPFLDPQSSPRQTLVDMKGKCTVYDSRYAVSSEPLINLNTFTCTYTADVMVLSDIIDQAAGRQSKSSERGNRLLVDSDFFAEKDEYSDEEKPSFKERFMIACLKSIDILCIWDCCWCWVRVQELFALIVFDPFMELFITLCIVVNTLFMAMDHHEMDPDFDNFLSSGNIFFTSIFAIEAFLKLIALSPKFYFREGWNIFDFTIVVLSLMELLFSSKEGGGGSLSVLRSFRLLRVFKLAKSWPTLNLLISIMGKTVGDLGNLTFVLAIIIFIFAVMGMQLFGRYYEENVSMFKDGEMPRWNFKDFMHSFMIVFRVLCGEWIQSMWDCMYVCGFVCVPFFLATVVIGNLVVLNLFLALLLSSFGASNLSAPTSDSADTKKLQEAFDRFSRAHKWIKSRTLMILKTIRSKTRNQIADQTTDVAGEMEDMTGDRVLIDGQLPLKDVKLLPPDLTDLEMVVGDGLEISIQGGKMKFQNSAKAVLNSVKVSQAMREAQKDKPQMIFANDQQIIGNKLYGKEEDVISNKSNNSLKKPSNEVSISSLLIPIDGEEKKDISKEDLLGMSAKLLDTEAEKEAENGDIGDKVETKTEDVIEEEGPIDCFPETWYQRFPCCYEDTPFWRRWKWLRYKSYWLVEHKYFETLVIILILISSMTLALEDENLKQRQWLVDILVYVDKFFTIIFLFEMLLKWVAYGFRAYFANAWCWLDFVIVMVSILNLLAGLLGFQKVPAFRTMRTLRALRPLRALSRLEGMRVSMLNLVADIAGGAKIQAFKTMRTLRALRPLRAMSRMQGMRVVVNALVQAIPAIFNVLLVCLIFWLIFAIMGVNMMAGKFDYCRDKETKEQFNSSYVANKTVCLSLNNTEWYNPQVNFDNVLNGYLSLFQVATFKGWLPIMTYAIDSREKYMQPEYEVNIYMYLYFVFFIIFGSFFTLNLFIGVIIDNFNEQKKKAGGSLEMFMTEDQKKYYNAMKRMGSKKPVKAIPRPRFKMQALIFDITTNKKFDMIIMLFIMLNMAVMAADKYKASKTYDMVLDRLNLFFIAIFTAECGLKIFALRWYYFKEPWNVFDFVVVILSIAGSMLKDFIEKYFVSPTLLRVVRVVKIGRVLRLVKGARGIRTLLFALAMSLPALFNICLLLFLVMFIYAIFGMSFFMNVKKRYGIDNTFNFGTFFKSFILLFQMCTSAGWDEVLAGIMDETECRKPSAEDDDPGDCGSKGTAIAYLVTYLIITFLVIINMYIAVILENYSQATEDVQEGLTDDDYDMYYEIWQKFDPNGTQFIPYSALSDLFDALEEPLQIPKPNKYKIISMDIPICVDDMCNCVEILDALTKDFFARKGHAIEETAELPEVLPLKGQFVHISSTLKRPRENYCATVIQRAWRKYKAREGGCIDNNEDNNKLQKTAIIVESDGHVTKNGHKVVIHSRSPSVTSRSTDV
ncbi:skeletal muscle sodium channel alpha subunit-like protein, partial [Dinothrombium tinctorium]